MSTRVQAWSHRKMVTLHGDPVIHEGAAVLLVGVADNLAHPVCAVRLDDGREVLIRREHLEVVT